jgi:hypothetical protein
MAIEPAAPLGTAEFDACAHDLEREARLRNSRRTRRSILRSRRNSGRAATRRLVTDIADQMGRGKRFRRIFRRTGIPVPTCRRHSNRRDPHDVFECPGDRHRKVAVIAATAVAVIKRAVVGVAIGAAIHMQMRRGFAPESRTSLKADRLQDRWPSADTARE